MIERPKDMHLDSNASKPMPSSHTISKKKDASRDDVSALGVAVSFIFTGFSLLVSYPKTRIVENPFEFIAPISRPG